MSGLVWSLADYRLHQRAVLVIDCHWACKCPVLLRNSGFVQHASYALHDGAVRPFDDCIRLRWRGRSRFLSCALWFEVFCEFLGGVLTASICTKSRHLLVRLLFCKSHPFFEFLKGCRLVRQYVLIGMPRGIVDEQQNIATSSDGCFQGTAFVPVQELQWLSGTGGRGSKGLSRQFAFDASLAIAVARHFQSISDRRQDLQHFETKVSQAAELLNPLICIVPRCMPSRLKCQQATVVDSRVFGRFRSSILN